MKQLVSTITILLYLLFTALGVAAQGLPYGWNVLDLDKANATDLTSLTILDDKVFLKLEKPGAFEMMVFDGDTIQKTFVSDETIFLDFPPIANGRLVLQNGTRLSVLDSATDRFNPLLLSRPSAVNVVEDQIYILTGNELYISDGTRLSAQLVRAFTSIHPKEQLVHSIDTLQIFLAEEKLWRTDGIIYDIVNDTIDGTFVIAENFPDSINHVFTPYNNLLFYTVTDSLKERTALWVVDGTLAGTKELAIKEGTMPAFSNLQVTDNGIIFMAQEDSTNMELWISDGTVAGTRVLVDSIISTSLAQDSLKIDSLQGIQNVGFFRKAHELWISDGTVENTIALLDFSNQANYDATWQMDHFFENKNGTIFFTTNQEVGFTTLWAYTIGAANPFVVTKQPVPFNFTTTYSSGSMVYFHEIENKMLWGSDGTAPGTLPLIEMDTFCFLGTFNDLIYFKSPTEASRQQYGAEPFISDGTIEGTKLLKDIFQGKEGSKVSSFFSLNNQIYFYARDQVINQAIYTTDGTEAGTIPVKDLYPSSMDSSPSSLLSHGDKLSFLIAGNLWISDGTLEGTNNLELFVRETDQIFGALNGRIVFYNHKGILYSTDGTKEGTIPLIDDGGTYVNAVRYKGELWFFLRTYSDNTIGLWKTDGTKEGTKKAFDNMVGENPVFPGYNNDKQMATNGELLFFRNDSEVGKELWVSDGTLAGTKLIKDLVEGSSSGFPNYFNRIQDKMLFAVGSKTWISDGTTEGTVLLVNEDIDRHSTVIDLETISVFNTETGIWATDGTPEGTSLLQSTFEPRHLTKFNNEVIFTSRSSANQLEIWRTTGQANSTDIIKLLNFKTSSTAIHLAWVGEHAFLGVFDRASQNDGTKEMTIEVSFQEASSINLQDPVNYKEQLFFIGKTNLYGKEIYSINLNPITNVAGQIYDIATENGINHIAVLAENGSLFTSYSKPDGQYSFSLPNGSYTVSPVLNQCWALASDSSAYQIAILDNSISDLDFALQKISNEDSLEVVINSGPTRCNEEVPFWITISNKGCTTVSGSVNLQLGHLVEFIRADRPPTFEQDTLFKWGFEDLEAASTLQINLVGKVASEDFVDTPIRLQASVYLHQNEVLKEMDQYAYESLIRCAIDPNDKQVLPSRIEPSNSNYTQIGETLSYQIRFQNTGTDTAFQVRIVDTLSTDLDVASFEPVAASHPFQTTIYPKGIIEFLFDDIVLPDSTTNLVESQGFVSFTITSKDSITDFSKVDNQAAIYFDLNRPIFTNTIHSTIVEHLDFDKDGYFFWEDCADKNANINPMGIEIPDNSIDEDCDGEDLLLSDVQEIAGAQLHIYPNPFKQHLSIEFTGTKQLTGKLYTVTGQLQEQIRIQPGQNSLTLSNLASGIYFLKVSVVDDNTSIITRIVKQ